jgi:hypothetical protein
MLLKVVIKLFIRINNNKYINVEKNMIEDPTVEEFYHLFCYLEYILSNGYHKWLKKIDVKGICSFF